MRIGLLLKEPGPYADLAQGLIRHGHDVAIYTGQEPRSLREYAAMASFLKQSQGFDLIHNTIGAAPLLFARFLETPFLTTIDAYPMDEDLAIYHSALPYSYFVATDETRMLPGITFLFVIQKGTDILSSFLGAYELIRSENGREDNRPWGYYRVLVDAPDHKVKRITVWPGKRLSLQSHKFRAEHWIIIAGQARVTVHDQLFDLAPSASIDIPRGAAHRIQNTGEAPLVFIEIQQGEYFGEDDITRLEDDFGRT